VFFSLLLFKINKNLSVSENIFLNSITLWDIGTFFPLNSSCNFEYVSFGDLSFVPLISIKSKSLF